MNEIEQEFLIQNKSDSPLYYLGNDVKIKNNKQIHISTKKYVTEIIRKFRTVIFEKKVHQYHQKHTQN
jgi:hypothetical protein